MKTFENAGPGERLLALMVEVYGDTNLAVVCTNAMIQGLQLALKHPEWAHAFTTWAEGHVNASGMAYPALDDDLARAIIEFGKIEAYDG